MAPASRRGLIPLLLILLAGAAVADDQGRPAQASVATPAVTSHQAPSRVRPRIALVLSGGGARGLAHVGIFKTLERMRVPYDCIVGTSMGAIAGGAFATGISTQEAQHRVEQADWGYLFADKPVRSDIPYFRKEDDWKGYFGFSLLLKDGKLYTPRNFLGVQHIDLFFRELTGARYSGDFDELPVPYRAMGTDIVTGQAVEIRDGTVATAMRASMGVPGVFPPILYHGHLLVDGGISRNIPVDEGRQLCGDVVIVVNVSTPTLKEEELNSFYNIGQQVISIAMQRNMDEQLKKLDPKKDVLITPDFGNYTAADFNAVHELIEIGEEAADEAAPQLQQYALSEADYAVWKAGVTAKRTTPPVVHRVSVGVTRWVNPDVMQSLLDVPLGKPFDMEHLHGSIARVYSRGDFDSISYDLKPMPEGEDGAQVIISPTEKAGRDSVRFGLKLQTDSNNASDFGVLASLRRVWLNRLDAEWTTDAEIGSNQRLYSEWYQPLKTDGVVFVAPHANYENVFHDVILNGTPISEYEVRKYGGGVDIGSAMGRWGQVRIGAYEGRASLDPILGVSLGNQNERRSGYTLRASYDQLDNSQFPHAGSAVTLDGFFAQKSFGSLHDWSWLDLDARTAFTYGRNTVLLDARVGNSLGTTLPFYEYFHLGGLFNLSAYRPWASYGNNLLYARAQFYRQIATLPSVVGRGLYAGLITEAGAVSDGQGVSDPRFENLHYSNGIYFAADSSIGPFYLAAARGSGIYSVYVALGVKF
jgi:NTE family protein